MKWLANRATMLVHDEDCEFAAAIRQPEEFDDLGLALRDGYSEAGCCLTDDPYCETLALRAQQRAELSEAGCLVCGEKRCIESAHIKPRSIGGQTTMPLCPLHHRAYDRGRLTPREIKRLISRVEARYGSGCAQMITTYHGAIAGRHERMLG